jgi:predicted SAM-dependent methyltransferase
VADALKMAVPSDVSEKPPLAMAAGPGGFRLDLACGQSPREGFQGVDLLAQNAQYKVDLFKFPWPWKDGSVDDLHSSHFVEHIPAREIEERDMDLSRCESNGLPSSGMIKDFVGKDMLFAFFDECWRILKKNGKMTVLVPCLRNDRAFQDPTHRRFIPAQMFLYLNDPWRKENKLDHYRVRCNFDVKCDPIVPMEMTLYHPEAQAIKLNHYWNSIIDWTASLTALK